MTGASVLIFLLLAFPYRLSLEVIVYFVVCTAIALGLSLLVFCKLLNKENKQQEKKSLEASEKMEYDWQSAKEKEDFFAMWAHQIKTPISAMQLLLQADDCDVKACRQELFKIENYVEMALGFLRFDEMNQDLSFETVSLDRAVKQLVKKYATVFIHRHLSVEMRDLDVTILTDEKWFLFALEQVLSNALKYTKEGGVTIWSQKEGEKIGIYVKDTGIGIRAEDLPRVFEKGFTGYNGRIDKKASGLGLYLCKGIFDKLGNEIAITSAEGEGTCVKITCYPETVAKNDLSSD